MKVYAVYANSDQTEGRGHDVVRCLFRKLEDAVAYGRKRYITFSVKKTYVLSFADEGIPADDGTVMWGWHSSTKTGKSRCGYMDDRDETVDPEIDRLNADAARLGYKVVKA